MIELFNRLLIDRTDGVIVGESGLGQGWMGERRTVPEQTKLASTESEKDGHGESPGDQIDESGLSRVGEKQGEEGGEKTGGVRGDGADSVDVAAESEESIHGEGVSDEQTRKDDVAETEHGGGKSRTHAEVVAVEHWVAKSRNGDEDGEQFPIVSGGEDGSSPSAAAGVGRAVGGSGGDLDHHTTSVLRQGGCDEDHEQVVDEEGEKKDGNPLEIGQSERGGLN